MVRAGPGQGPGIRRPGAPQWDHIGIGRNYRIETSYPGDRDGLPFSLYRASGRVIAPAGLRLTRPPPFGRDREMTKKRNWYKDYQGVAIVILLWVLMVVIFGSLLVGQLVRAQAIGNRVPSHSQNLKKSFPKVVSIAPATEGENSCDGTLVVFRNQISFS